MSNAITPEIVDEEVFIVCGPQSFFIDDIKTNCIDCESEVFHRPHAPKGSHICLPCAIKRSLVDPQFARTEVKVTKETIKEIKEELEMRKSKN